VLYHNWTRKPLDTFALVVFWNFLSPKFECVRTKADTHVP